MELNVGVIGCGSISRFHFSGLTRAKATIRWVCDVNQDAAAPWAQKFGAKSTSDYRQVIADPKVNVIDVTAVSRIHKAVCLDAIAAGKAIICEKTLAENADDALEIVQAAAKNKTHLYTSYMKRFIPAVQKAHELLPGIGRIISTHIRSFQPWGKVWEAMPSEGLFYKPAGGSSLIRARYGGGILVCGGSHMLDLVNHFLGRPTRLFARVYVPEGRDYELLASALMETNNGIVHFDAVGHPLSRVGFLRDGWDETVEINGTLGRLNIYSATWDQFDHKASLLVHYDEATSQTNEYRYSPDSPFERAVMYFCQQIRSGEQGYPPRSAGYDVDELIAAMYRSSAQKQAIDVAYRIEG